jgi:hypothetical protein
MNRKKRGEEGEEEKKGEIVERSNAPSVNQKKRTNKVNIL